jgi:Alpha/beta hydrolase family
MVPLLPRLGYPVVVLVAGAWHAGWAWRRVAPALAAYGWRTALIELPSTAGAGMPRRGLHDDAAVVRRQMKKLIDGTGEPAVVVAHSYAGAAVSEGLDGIDAVRHIVYLAAFQLDVGESVLGIAGDVIPRWWRIDQDLVTPADPYGVFFHDVPVRDARWAVEQLQPVSFAAFRETLDAAAWHAIPSTYVLCERDRAQPIEVQKRFAARATRVERLATGHSPFLARPAELTQLIIDVAENV